MLAKILKSDKRVFTCSLLEEKGSPTVQATALGKLLKGDNDLVVGDFVELKLENDEYIITKMRDRKNEIFRLLVRERKKKIIASNCDAMVVVLSVSKPSYKQGLLDRYLVRAFQWEVLPLIVFNKMDEHDPADVDILEEQKRLASMEIDCFEVSAHNEDYKPQYLEKGLSELKSEIDGKTVILLGHSGVGKSRLANCLTGEVLNLKSSKISDKSGKGAHTTTWAEIARFENLEIIDSPGVRSYSLEDVDPEDLIEFFPDIFEIARGCKFRNCEHLPTSKGCAFKPYYDKKDEFGSILSRLDSFHRIKDEISATPQWKKSF
ncbi:MAG: ribosome small subunit-dependent GTPase A [Bacteriovoracaceae bacterium]